MVDPGLKQMATHGNLRTWSRVTPILRVNHRPRDRRRSRCSGEVRTPQETWMSLGVITRCAHSAATVAAGVDPGGRLSPGVALLERERIAYECGRPSDRAVGVRSPAPLATHGADTGRVDPVHGRSRSADPGTHRPLPDGGYAIAVASRSPGATGRDGAHAGDHARAEPSRCGRRSRERAPCAPRRAGITARTARTDSPCGPVPGVPRTHGGTGRSEVVPVAEPARAPGGFSAAPFRRPRRSRAVGTRSVADRCARGGNCGATRHGMADDLGKTLDNV